MTTCIPNAIKALIFSLIFVSNACCLPSDVALAGIWHLAFGIWHLSPRAQFVHTNCIAFAMQLGVVMQLAHKHVMVIMKSKDTQVRCSSVRGSDPTGISYLGRWPVHTEHPFSVYQHSTVPIHICIIQYRVQSDHRCTFLLCTHITVCITHYTFHINVCCALNYISVIDFRVTLVACIWSVFKLAYFLWQF